MADNPTVSEVIVRLCLTLRQILRVLRWSITLPLIGLVILNIMLPPMLLPTFLAPWLMVKWTMTAGFVPSLITVVVHFLLAERVPRLWLIPITVSISTLTAWLWWGLFLAPKSTKTNALGAISPTILIIAALASLPLAIWARPNRKAG